MSREEKDCTRCEHYRKTALFELCVHMTTRGACTDAKLLFSERGKAVSEPYAGLRGSCADCYYLDRANKHPDRAYRCRVGACPDLLPPEKREEVRIYLKLPAEAKP